MQYSDLHTANLTLEFFNPANKSHYEKIFHSYSYNPTPLSSYAEIDERARNFSIPAGLCPKSPPPTYPWLLCHVTNTGDYIGHVAAHYRGEWPALGWAIHPDAQGKGYATEAAKALLEFCDNVLGMERIGAMMDSDYLVSRRVAEKLGGKIIEGQEQSATERGEMIKYEWIFGDKDGE